jgi:hypothetical protein
MQTNLVSVQLEFTSLLREYSCSVGYRSFLGDTTEENIAVFFLLVSKVVEVKDTDTRSF